MHSVAVEQLTFEAVATAAKALEGLVSSGSGAGGRLKILRIARSRERILVETFAEATSEFAEMTVTANKIRFIVSKDDRNRLVEAADHVGNLGRLSNENMAAMLDVRSHIVASFIPRFLLGDAAPLREATRALVESAFAAEAALRAASTREHPAVRAMRDAPLDDEELSASELQEIDRLRSDAREGETIETEELLRRLGMSSDS